MIFFYIFDTFDIKKQKFRLSYITTLKQYLMTISYHTVICTIR